MKNLIKKYRVSLVLIIIFTPIIYFMTTSAIHLHGMFFADSGEYLAMDIRIFKDSPVWELAKEVKDDDGDEIVELIKSKNFNVNYQESKYNCTLLMLAVYNHWYNSVKALLENGADPHLTNIQGDNGILLAAGLPCEDESDTRILKLVLMHGGDPNFVRPINEIDQSQETPLVIASRFSLEKVKLLLSYGANVNYYVKENNFIYSNPLDDAITFEKIDIVKYLLKNGANCNLILNIYENGDSIRYVNYLRGWRYPINSLQYNEKMALVQYFKDSCGQDYFKTPIPREMYQGYDSAYIEKY